LSIQLKHNNMKRILPFLLIILSFPFINYGQGLKGLMKKTLGKDSALLGGSSTANLSTTEMIGGLKEALSKGVETGTAKLSSPDGFFKDAVLKILMPEEAKKAEMKLRGVGLGNQVDEAILTMNRAAEDASKSAANIFINAIKQMSIQDAASILKGGDFAATEYLKSKTTIELTNAFRPVIENSLDKVDATKHWNTVFTTYNKFSFDKVNPDLSAYVTEKAMAGIFYQIGLEEQKIRKDPMAQTSELLKKVFGKG
jgi:hypothetical protein